MTETPPKVDDYRFGKIVIDGKTYQSDVIILPDRVVPDWWRESGHSLVIEDLEEVLTSHPRVLILGSGAYQRMRVPGDTLTTLRDRGIDVRVFSTAEACKAYNQMREERGVAAALHLTC